jgi:SAM-dependent methyltransferase
MNQQLKSFLQRIKIYHPLQSSYRSARALITNQYHRLSYSKYRGKGFVCNFCGATYQKFVPEYPSTHIQRAINDNNVIAGFGENVFCPRCGSKNRERLIRAVIEKYLEPIGEKKILHFSPEKNLYRFLNAIADVSTVDIAPGFYRNIDAAITYADATRLAWEDKTVDLVIANHILEHIPEDQIAMKEICRVLKNDGVAILQVPYSPTLPHTIEDPFIDDPARQAALYGQKDHVRIYALKDYIHRLEQAGFRVRVLTPEDLSPFLIHAIQPGEAVFLGYKK